MRTGRCCRKEAVRSYEQLPTGQVVVRDDTLMGRMASSVFSAKEFTSEYSLVSSVQRLPPPPPDPSENCFVEVGDQWPWWAIAVFVSLFVILLGAMIVALMGK